MTSQANPQARLSGSKVLVQAHLDVKETINLGSFYTPSLFVEFAYQMLEKAMLSLDTLSNQYELLDSSCGYGNFFCGVEKYAFKKICGMDIDRQAIEIAKHKFPMINLYCGNALEDVTRSKFGIDANELLIIVGNPPYNDKTSMVRSGLKQQNTFKIDSDLMHRDLGVSFLLSYAKLQADFICILHPLSYLIKEANFKSLKYFTSKYKLIDSLIVSSSFFCPNSIGYFPISISLFQKDCKGMSYEYIKNFSFKTLEGKQFKISSFDYIGRYIDKYPNKSRVLDSQRVAMFHTMRDINALRRSKTFVTQENYNTINVPQNKYSLYCYVDVFKKMIPHVPYYLGNCDVFIDYEKFKILEKDFIYSSNTNILKNSIFKYFDELLGEHFIIL